MDFRLRLAVHVGRDVLADGETTGVSTGDVVFSGSVFKDILQLSMSSGRAYVASAAILCDKGIKHGVLAPDQASLSIALTIKPDISEPSGLARIAGIFGTGMDLGRVLSVNDRSPPSLCHRLREASHYDQTNNSSDLQRRNEHRRSTGSR